MNSYSITYHLVWENGNEATKTVTIQDLNEARAKTRLESMIDFEGVKLFEITECKLKAKLF
jgi:hypothetical protein